MRKASRRPAAPARALGLALALLSQGAPAHVPLKRTTLREWLQSSDAALVAEILSPPLLWVAPDGSDRQDYFRARRVERIAGEATPEAFEFSPHAEGLPGFEPGDRVLLFLERSAGHPELAELAHRFPWVSEQGPGAAWKLAGPEGEAVLRRARELAALRTGDETERLARLRTLVWQGLGSTSPALRDDARSELIQLRGALLQTPEDVTPFAARVREGGIPLSERIVLSRILAGAPGFDASATWALLAEQARRPADRIALMRIGATSEEPALIDWIAGQLSDPDTALRREAAWALGRARWPSTVPALAAASADPDEAVSRAAIGALGAIGDAAARAALERLRDEAGDPRARWAAAELRRPSTPLPQP